MNILDKLCSLLISKTFRWSIVIFIILFFICLFLGLKNIAFSIGGDSFGSFFWFDQMKMYGESSVVYGHPFEVSISPPELNIIHHYISLFFMHISINGAVYFNMQIFFNIFSSFIICFLFSTFFINDFKHKEVIVLFFGISVSFSSYNLMHFFTGHLGFQLIFLLLWLFSFYLFFVAQNFKTVTSLCLITIITTLYNAYYGFFILLFFLYSVFHVCIFQRSQCKKYLLYVMILGFFSVFFIGLSISPFLEELLISHSQPEGTIYKRDSNSVIGVLPWMYLLPSPQNIFSPEIYKKFYREVMLIGNVPENSVYLGWFNIIFFCYGFNLFKRRVLSDSLHNMYRFILGAAIFCFMLSLPPFISLGSGNRLYWITGYLYKIFPMFRVYNRFGIFVIILVSTGALIGFYSFIRKYDYQSKKIVVFSLILIFFELIFMPPLLDLSIKTDAYDWIKGQNGEFIVYEIPEEKEKDDYIFYKYLYYQNFHGKKLFNHGPVNIDLNKQGAKKKLKDMNVKFLIQHTDFYEEGPIPKEQKPYVHRKNAEEKFNNGLVEQLPPCYEIRKKFNNIVIYSIF